MRTIYYEIAELKKALLLIITVSILSRAIVLYHGNSSSPVLFSPSFSLHQPISQSTNQPTIAPILVPPRPVQLSLPFFSFPPTLAEDHPSLPKTQAPISPRRSRSGPRNARDYQILPTLQYRTTSQSTTIVTTRVTTQVLQTEL